MSTLRERLRVLRERVRDELTPATGVPRNDAQTQPDPERFGDWEEWSGGEGRSDRAPEATPLAGRSYYTQETDRTVEARVEDFPLPSAGYEETNSSVAAAHTLAPTASRLVAKLRNRDRLREMIVIREILDRPVALRPRRTTVPR